VIFLDSNIPMYLVGAPHPHKTDAQLLLERTVAAGERMVTDAEVLQEILHRYAAVGRREAIKPALGTLLRYVDQVFPIEEPDVLRAAEILEDPLELSARDALHLAVMERHGVSRIMSFDADFDRCPAVTRICSL
jgi:predicted nucleic acid-binding protein